MTPKFRDKGCNGKRSKVRPIKGQTRGVCRSCERQEIVAVTAWSRKCRPQCKRCGGFLDPSKAAQKEHPEACAIAVPHSNQRVCVSCGCKLNSYNKSTECFACSQKETEKYV